MKDVKKNSTLAINSETSARLDLFCRKNKITKKDFVTLALGYFERTGVNINSNDIVVNLHQINSKIDTVIEAQNDATFKLSDIQEIALTLSELKKDYRELIEQKEKYRSFFNIFRKL